MRYHTKNIWAVGDFIDFWKNNSPHIGSSLKERKRKLKLLIICLKIYPFIKLPIGYITTDVHFKGNKEWIGILKIRRKMY